MGLDMYLRGVQESSVTGTGDKELGYWRKHPNLHGFFVNEFANGVDECQKIPLTVDDLKKTLNATVENTLPETSGFFFGTSMPEDREETIKILTEAIKWASEDGFARTVYYRASWQFGSLAVPGTHAKSASGRDQRRARPHRDPVGDRRQGGGSAHRVQPRGPPAAHRSLAATSPTLRVSVSLAAT